MELPWKPSQEALFLRKVLLVTIAAGANMQTCERDSVKLSLTYR